jgi:uncharacterized protein (DUF362 family)
MAKGMSRREFLILAGQTGALLAGAGVVRSLGQSSKATAVVRRRRLGNPELLAVAHGDILGKSEREAEALLRACLEPLGGIKTFVAPGSKVVLKPNGSFMRTPEQASSTNPLLVTAMATLCLQAGAKEVIVFDHTIDTPSDVCLSMTGMVEAARKGKAQLVSGHEQSAYQQVSIPRGRVLTSAEVHRVVLGADVLINMPIAKVHGATGATLGMKNLMGVVWNRATWHSSSSLDQCIADFSTAYPATLTIIDGQRVLLTNGPKGPGRTEDKHAVVAGVDPVAVDAYSAGLLDFAPERVPHIADAARMGVGQMDLRKVRVVKVS